MIGRRCSRISRLPRGARHCIQLAPPRTRCFCSRQQQLTNLDPKRVGQRLQRAQCLILLAAFEITHVRPMQAGFIGEPLPANRRAQCTDNFRKQLVHVPAQRVSKRNEIGATDGLASALDMSDI